mmetsp:Transcript_43797/g.115771  ORF Transcript_43797/g.115771 Transcript_43797/m.115771 type:complete len:242 (+) Transcript_43797:737-1462(+)
MVSWSDVMEISILPASVPRGITPTEVSNGKAARSWPATFQLASCTVPLASDTTKDQTLTSLGMSMAGAVSENRKVRDAPGGRGTGATSSVQSEKYNVKVEATPVSALTETTHRGSAGNVTCITPWQSGSKRFPSITGGVMTMDELGYMGCTRWIVAKDGRSKPSWLDIRKLTGMAANSNPSIVPDWYAKLALSFSAFMLQVLDAVANFGDWTKSRVTRSLLDPLMLVSRAINSAMLKVPMH